jgi:hypothetical protein
LTEIYEIFSEKVQEFVVRDQEIEEFYEESVVSEQFKDSDIGVFWQKIQIYEIQLGLLIPKGFFYFKAS